VVREIFQENSRIAPVNELNLTCIKALLAFGSDLESVEPKIYDISKHKAFVRGGISSKTLQKNSSGKVILFQFDAGQQLSEHTATVPAVMHFLDGEARVKLGTKIVNAKPGTWIHMEAGALHAIDATTRTTMLLTLFIHPSQSI